MFQNLSDRLSKIFQNLTRRGVLTEDDVNSALREIRIALLEADVALPVVKDFIEKVRLKATGQKVVDNVMPGQMVVKIVHDELASMLGGTTAELNLATTPPAVIMLVGLQGSGKTTSTAKLARYLKEKLKKKVMVASLDIYRPAAQEQLAILARSLDIACLESVTGEKPEAITKRALKEARLSGMDVLLLDTAGRLHIDGVLMDELVHVTKLAAPIETLLVVDAMTGQDALNVAQAFHAALTLTGIMLTRLDGDARGGVALSMKHVTGCPIKFVGVGEKVDQLEVFHPDRMAGRILDQGDVVSLVEKAMDTLDKQEVDALHKKIGKGSFDLNDMATQLRQMQKMGGLAGFIKMLPGMGDLQNKLSQTGINDRTIKRQIAIIQSMTPRERQYYQLLNGSRRKRIAAGSGTTVQDVNRLLKQFEGAQKMMQRMNKLGKKGLLRDGLQGLFP